MNWLYGAHNNTLPLDNYYDSEVLIIRIFRLEIVITSVDSGLEIAIDWS